MLDACADETIGEEYGVIGGRDEVERYTLRIKRSDTINEWADQAQRLAMGRHIADLSARRVTWLDIARTMGLTPSACQELHAQYLIHRGRAVPKNTGAKNQFFLTRERQSEILRLLDRGHSRREVARMMGCSPATVRRAITTEENACAA